MSHPIRVVALLAWFFSSAATADPLNVELGMPVPSPTYLGFPATLSIHVEPTFNPSSVTGLSAIITPLGITSQQFLLDSHTCPGTMVEGTGGGHKIIEWTGMGNLSNAQEINCEITLLPTVLIATVMLEFDCDSCTDPAGNRSIVEMEAEEPMDLQASLILNAHPTVGQHTLTVRFGNYGTGAARNVGLALYGSPALFGSMLPLTADNDCDDVVQDFESATWEITQLDPGQIEECDFKFNVPDTNEHLINLSIIGQSMSGQDDPYPVNNIDTVTLQATDIVVNTRFSFYPDANPGDGICADTDKGACSLRAAVQETNALPGYQTITVPYEFGGYYLGGLTGYLTITDPVQIIGLPDPATGDWPWITRSDGEDAGLIHVHTRSTTETRLRNLDLRGQDLLVSVDGAVVWQQSGDLRITNAIISGGRTTGAGGGVRGVEGLLLAGVEFRDNEAAAGGAVAVFSAVDNDPDAWIVGSTFHGNSAHASGSGAGGAVYFINAKAEIERSSFLDNSADRGGAIFITGGSDVHVINTTIAGNTAETQGGGIYDGSSNTSLEYVTLVYNEAGPDDLSAGEGGGVYVVNPGAGTDINNSIIAYNQAQSTGGLIGFPKGANCYGSMDGFNNSLNGIANDPDCSVVGDPNTLNAAPALSALQTDDRGGGYYRLIRVNQEIDQAGVLCENELGSPLFSDQLSLYARPKDGNGDGEPRCDKGAIEANPASLAIQVSESGPADWRIALSEPWVECVTPECNFYFIPIGSNVELTAEPAPGTVFDGWGGACASEGANLSCTIPVAQREEVTASFSSSATPRTLTVAANGPGSVTSTPGGIDCPADCSEVYADGTVLTLTATPDEGNVFSGWSGACTGTGSCEVTMNAAKSVQAQFGAATDLIFSDGFEN